MRALAFIFCLIPLAAAAEPACDEAATPAQEAACMSDIAGSKKRLNGAYGALAKKVGPDTLPLLEKAQKAWLTYRNAECDYQSEPLGGASMISSARIICTADMNNKRAAELEEALKTGQ